NLCRCTGYRPILEAFYSFAVKENGDIKVTETNGCAMGDKCCKVTKKGCPSGETNGLTNGTNGVSNGFSSTDEENPKFRQEKLKLTDLSKTAAYDPSQELIFPPELKSIAGNIVTASPISDLNPIWMAAGAKIVLESDERGVRSPVIDEHFFLAYRKADVEADEVVKAVIVPFTKKNQFFRVYKQAQRREDDIAIVTGAFNAVVAPDTLIEMESIAA
ncbi:FAD binding domain in molybdopterin dehydrogenase, partial [Teladorsagia circumcincta]